MPFRPIVNQTLVIDQTEYRVCAHPSAREMPYGQAGRRATVYQLVDSSSNYYALKVFTPAFRSAQIYEGAAGLRPFAALSGLQVCARSVLHPGQQAALLQAQPDLTYAALMPWVRGETWSEVILSARPLSTEQCHKIASRLLEILLAMEANQLAHCDLSGPNLLVDLRTDAPGVALVDVEEMYAPGLQRPARLPAGSAGYAHQEAHSGLWKASADRFAGAVLLAEVLGWCDERVRRIPCGEQYFDPNELQANSDRYTLLLRVLRERWGDAVAQAFARAWFSATLEVCPSFAEWAAALPKTLAARPTPAQPVPPVQAGAMPLPAAAPRPSNRGKQVALWAGMGVVVLMLCVLGAAALLLQKSLFPSLFSSANAPATQTAAAAQAVRQGATQTAEASNASQEKQAALSACAHDVSEPLALNWRILACDNFDNNSANWPSGTYSDAFISAGDQVIGGGKYILSGQAVQGVTWLHKSSVDPVTDFSATVRARRTAGPADSVCYGIVFRYDEKNQIYYLFEACDDRQFKVDYGDGSQLNTLQDWTLSDAIQPDADNWLSVVGEGSQFRFFINGSQVASLSDSHLKRGYLGVFNTAVQGDQFSVDFAHFLVRAP
jgi:serine/threonine protein kinase